jgi:hypothetical protein
MRRTDIPIPRVAATMADRLPPIFHSSKDGWSSRWSIQEFVSSGLRGRDLSESVLSYLH